MCKVLKWLKYGFKSSHLISDNLVFQLHYTLTTSICIIFALLVICSQNEKDTLSCVSKDVIPSKFLDAFCWLHSTYSRRKNVLTEMNANESAANGVLKNSRINYDADDHSLSLFLILQASFFFFPRFVWKLTERTKIEHYVVRLQNLGKKRAQTTKAIAKSLMAYFRKKDKLFIGYFLAEVLNVLNAILQLVLLRTYFSELSHNIDVIEIPEDQWSLCWTLHCDFAKNDTLKMKKVTIHRYGSYGVETSDAMVVLPVNVIYEKVYVFLLYWLTVLTCLSILNVLYRTAIILSPQLRFTVLKLRMQPADQEMLYRVLNNTDISAWFVILVISKNLDPFTFKWLITALSSELDDEEAISGNTEI